MCVIETLMGQDYLVLAKQTIDMSTPYLLRILMFITQGTPSRAP